RRCDCASSWLAALEAQPTIAPVTAWRTAVPSLRSRSDTPVLAQPASAPAIAMAASVRDAYFRLIHSSNRGFPRSKPGRASLRYIRRPFDTFRQPLEVL